jgi:hypothetical protein
VPVGEFLFVVTVSVELPPPLTDVGLNDALVRFGNPLKVKFTAAENGPSGVIVTVYDTFEPLRTVWLLGEAEIEKSATTSVT